MDTPTTTATPALSPLEMSDEDIMKMSPSQFEGLMSAPEQASPEASEPEDTQDEAEEVDQGEDTPAAETQEEEGDETEDTQEASDAGQGEGQAPTETDPAASQDASQKDSEEAPAVDYEAEYNRLLAPFKANGREVRVKSVDDAISLMQMGVNYNKKMAGLKPYLKAMKTLENHGLMDEQELGFLIDLKQKKPGAIEKLLKDSGIDPMDIDAEKAEGYQPGTYTVPDQEIELDQVIEELKESPSFDRTASFIKGLDEKSREEVAKFPQGIKIINDLVDAGMHDLILQEVENERLFGRLQGLSDLEAYRQVGDQLQARGAFDHLGRQGQQMPTQQKVVVPNPKKEDDSKRREKRRAASPTKSTGPTAAKQEFNPLALSDDEFSKLATQRFL